MTESIEKVIVKADILIIGGGPAGLMAAIRAADLGIENIVVAEKSNTKRSGCASGGNDHFMCYIPEVHGTDTRPIIKEQMQSLSPFFGDMSYMHTWLDLSFEMVKLWDSWGIPMKYKGGWKFAGHSYPGRPLIWLKYTGGNQKPVLTKQALKRGVKIMNRVPIFELIKDGDRVTGALGYDTWNDRMIEYQAKVVFLGTGDCARLYRGSTGLLFNTARCPTNTGDGRAMALRAGADLLNLEFTGRWAGPKYFARAGKASWIGVLRDSADRPVGPFITKPDKTYGDVISDAYPKIFEDYMKSGKGPVFMDCRGATEEDLTEMKHWLMNEGNAGFLAHMEEEGINPLQHPVEFRTYEPILRGGLWFSNKSETSVKGLYAAGDEYPGGMAKAVIWGWVAGETMARDVTGSDFGNPKKTEEQVADKIGKLKDILNRKVGSNWEEANIAVQEIMADYVGSVRSESLFDQAQRNLAILRDRASKTLKACNGHELLRCLEVLNLIEVGEAVVYAAQERKETRGNHVRSDYPFSNPLLDQQLLVKKREGEFVSKWKNLKETNE